MVLHTGMSNEGLASPQDTLFSNTVSDGVVCNIQLNLKKQFELLWLIDIFTEKKVITCMPSCRGQICTLNKQDVPQRVNCFYK